MYGSIHQMTYTKIERLSVIPSAANDFGDLKFSHPKAMDFDI
jgi:carboxylesterase type B